MMPLLHAQILTDLGNILLSDDPEDFEQIPLKIWVAGRHQNSDIWLQCASKEDHNFLVWRAPIWIPHLSPCLKLQFLHILWLSMVFPPALSQTERVSILQNSPTVIMTSFLIILCCNKLNLSLGTLQISFIQQNLTPPSFSTSLTLLSPTTASTNKFYSMAIWIGLPSSSDGLLNAIIATVMVILPVTVALQQHAVSVLVPTQLGTVTVASQCVQTRNPASIFL